MSQQTQKAIHCLQGITADRSSHVPADTEGNILLAGNCSRQIISCSSRHRRQHIVCRGDIDDRVLPEAILPLLDQLAAVDDVRPVLHRRFDMPRWLASHGLTLSRAAKTAGDFTPPPSPPPFPTPFFLAFFTQCCIIFVRVSAQWEIVLEPS